MSGPLLSIVIPTKDRADYAIPCVRTITRLERADLEIVIQDNSATADLGPRLGELGDARIRYEHRGGRLSVIDNCSLGVARARGEFVTLLGDDDAVSPGLPELAGWAAATETDAVTGARTAWYVWPDVRFDRYADEFSGTLTLRRFTGTLTERDVAAGLRRSLGAAFQDIGESLELPKLYYGIVRRRCLEALLREAGSVFPGVSPDMSVAIGVGKYVRRFFSVDYPVFLPGSSARSTAGAHARKAHLGRLEDQPHLPAGCTETWPVEVPPVFAVQTVWAQSAIAALRATGRGGMVEELDLGLLHAYCGVLNRGLWPAVLSNYRRATRAAGRAGVPASLSLARGFVRAWGLRARYLSGRLRRDPWYVGADRVAGLATVFDAAIALDGWMAARDARLRLPPAGGSSS